MVAPIEYVAGAASTITRLSSYVFLRWIPGHHFPPLIVSAALAYITAISFYSSSFHGERPTLRTAFPKLFRHEKENKKSQPRGTEGQDDEPSLYNDEKTAFKILLFGIPDWREWEFSYLTIAVNLLLTFLALDMVFRGPILYSGKDLRFSRVGYVDENSAKVLFREPDPAQLPVFSYYKALHASDWTRGDTVYWLSDDTDFTNPLTFAGLDPRTTYQYSLSNDLTGTFTTSPSSNDPRAASLSFLTTSCIKANFPYNFFANALDIHGFKHLSKVIQSLPSPPAFMMFLGDFIYVDVPLRLSSTFAHYRAEYRRVYQSRSWRLPGLSIPWIHTLDDHEIANDWHDGNRTAPFPAASDPFIHYHVSVNPPIPPSAPGGSDTNTTFFQFTNGPASFFMLDTRRYRTPPEPEVSHLVNDSSILNNGEPDYKYSMLGQLQLKSLLTFLRQPEPAGVYWKFVASSVPFTKNWRFGTPDTWGGYLSERAEILAAMHKAESELGVRVIILSGDRHEFAAIRYPSPKERSDAAEANVQSVASQNDTQRPLKRNTTRPIGPHEFSCGPLSMFYLPIRTFKQVDDEDVSITYLPDGNSKVGAISINPLVSGAGSSRPGAKSRLKYSLWIDGALKWEYTLTSPSSEFKGRRNVFASLWG